MWTELRYSNAEKEQRNAAYLKLSQLPPSIFNPCSSPLPVTPQQLTSTLEKIIHWEVPSHYDEHCVSTLKIGNEMKGVHHIFWDHRNREARKECNSSCALEHWNQGEKNKVIHPNNPSFHTQKCRKVHCGVA